MVNKQRILIVEDDLFIAMDLEGALIEEFDESAEIMAVDSLAGAALAAADGVDCALLDVDVIGGKTFRLALDLHRQGTPFAFVSGSLPADLPDELRTAPFVRKPFQARQIVDYVRSVLHQPGGARFSQRSGALNAGG